MTAPTSVLRFPKRLAGFARDEVGEVLLAGAHDIGEAAQRLDPVGDRMRRPFGPGGARRRRLRPRHRRSRRDQISAPVAGSVEISLFAHDAPALARCSHARGQAGQAGAASHHRVAHPADGGDLGLERRPVVALGDRRPDRLDLVDQHRAGRGVGPIRVGRRALRARRARRASASKAGVAYASPPGTRPPRQSKKKRSIPTARDRSASSSADDELAVLVAPRGATPSRASSRVEQRRLEPRRPAAEQVGQRRRLADQREAAGELRDVPLDRLGLAAEGVEPGMVEIGRGEALVPLGREAPRAIIEALAGDVDIVAVEHAMDEARGDVGGGERRRSRWQTRSNSRAAGGIVAAARRKVVEAIAGQLARCPSASSKKASRWKVPMRIWPWLSRVSTAERVGEGSSPRSSCSPVSNRAKLFDVLTPERLEHLGREHFAHAALERQPPVAVRLHGVVPAALGAEVEQAARDRRATARTGSRARRRGRDCNGGTGGRDSAARAAAGDCRGAARSARNALPLGIVESPARPARPSAG